MGAFSARFLLSFIGDSYEHKSPHLQLFSAEKLVIPSKLPDVHSLLTFLLLTSVIIASENSNVFSQSPSLTILFVSFHFGQFAHAGCLFLCKMQWDNEKVTFPE